MMSIKRVLGRYEASKGRITIYLDLNLKLISIMHAGKRAYPDGLLLTREYLEWLRDVQLEAIALIKGGNYVVSN